VRKGVRIKLASLFLWAAGVALFGFGVAVSGAGLAIVAGIAFGILGVAAMEYADRDMPAEGLREYATCCDPDVSQSWAVGIALGLARGCTPLQCGCEVGLTGFEPATSPTRTERATRLRHSPRGLA
jgi:F0F1-type ATP synthase membrane subunit c/vacuolar-type H+-ATPase subunit K